MKKMIPILFFGLFALSSLTAAPAAGADPYRDAQGYYILNPSNSTTVPQSTSYYQQNPKPAQTQAQTQTYQQPAQAPVSNRINWTTRFSDAAAQANAQRKPIVILFTGTSWCPACIKLEREVLNQPEFARAVGNNFIFLKAEFPDYSESGMRASPYRNLMERYNIEAFPTFIVINPNGQQLGVVNYQYGGPSAYAQQLLRIR